VATHVEHILRKLDVNSKTEAVAVAYRDGILRPG
jgi:DNA-binding NarL/FixJ family response regulator